MAIQLIDDEQPFPSPNPPIQAKRVLFVISMKRLSMLCLLALGRSTGILLWHLFFFWLARLVPIFDPSGALASSSLHKTWYIGILASYVLMVFQLLSFFVPFAVRYKACAAEGTLAPANKLRKSWRPAFYTPGMHHVSGKVGTVVTFAVASMLLRQTDWASGVLDPFYAGTLGTLGNLILQTPASQWQRLLGQIEREDEGDGVWRTN